MNTFVQTSIPLVLCSIVFSACTERRTSDTYVARVNDSYLTTEELREHIDTTSISSRQIDAYVNRWVSRELLFQEAQRQGLDRSPDIRSKIDEIEKDLVVTLLLDREIYDEELVSFSNEEALEYFDNHKEQFVLQKDVAKVNYVLFSDRESAKAFRARILRGTPWYDAVHDVENDPTAAAAIFGREDSAYITKEEFLPAPVWRAVSNTRVGRIPSPVKTEQGYFVLQLLSFWKSGKPAEFRYCLPEIRERLIVEKRRKQLENLLRELRQQYAVEVNLGEPSEPDTVYGPTEQ